MAQFLTGNMFRINTFKLLNVSTAQLHISGPAWNNTARPWCITPRQLHAHSIRCRADCQQTDQQEHVKGGTGMPASPRTVQSLPDMFIELYIFSAPFRVAFVTAGDRYAGAAEANKGLRLLWPALPSVTRWYLLRALF